MFRLKKNPGLLKEYDDIIKKQEEENIIEKIPENEGVATPGRVHYLPHHAVVRADRETTKLRVVYDASSNFPSLNQCLEKGPCFLPLIFDILVRFRAYKVALISDIKQAYLNVEVNREDRNFLRFFWFEDVNVETPKLAAYRFTRMIFGMNSSQFLLASVILKHLERYKDDPKFVKTFLRNLYVDDSVSGGENLHEALDLYVKSKYRLLEAGFTLRKWHSSDPTLDAKISSYENENIIEYASDPSMEGLKVLGVPWNNSADKFCLDLSTIQWGDEEVVNTKRTILKVIASIYDPLGLLAPATVLFKMFFQLLCISKLGWDRTLPDDLNVKWNKLICLSRNICVEVPRYYFGKNVVGDKEVILHGFCDASQRAYAAVIYLVADIGGKKIGHFVACKTKVAPIKSISIPQLELSSCVLLSNLFSSVVLALQGVIHISQSVCWSDSMDALFWIKEEHKRRTPFVENRIRKIREVIPSSCWRHCPGDLNPADFPSRGYEKYDNVINDKLISWVEGPDFIYKYQDQWPEDLSYKDNRVCSISKSYKKSEINDENGVNNVSLKLDIHGRPKNLICDVMSESIDQLINQKIEYEEAINKVKSSKINESVSIMVSAGVNAAHHKLDEIINYNNYSNFNRLLRVTAHVMRFVHNVSCKDVQLQKSGPLKFEEVAEVEIAWIRVIQQVFFNSNQMKWLKANLGVYFDDSNILRCKGRFENSMLNYNERNPILLPKKGHVQQLIIKKAHLDTEHGNIKDTLADLRSKYWIIHSRKLVTSFVSKCRRCKRLDGAPFKSQEAAQLPSFRVCQSHPFANTGVDYAGPFLVKPIFDDENSSNMVNVHIVLYTCAATRAVHLDVVPDTGAAAFLRSLKRFIGRRGVPNLMLSDNATCFKNEEVKLSEELVLLGIKWKFIVAASPWWGGFWERLIRSMKRSLNRIIFRASVNYDEFLTIIVEIEGIMNSRPLTYINADIEEILTPGHFLIGRRVLDRNDEDFMNGESEKVQLTKRAKYLKTIREHYWSRWKTEYLLELRNTHKQRADKETTIEVGEVVVIHDKTKRIFWRLGIVVKLLKGNDQRVRAVTLKTAKNGKPIYLNRPIEKLYPLELRSNETVSENDVQQAANLGSDEIDDIEVKELPRREAADNGILIRRLLGHF